MPQNSLVSIKQHRAGARHVRPRSFEGRITQFPIMKSAEIPAFEAFNPLDANGDFSTIADPHSLQRLGIFDK
jgi:hypothetical protein